MAEKLIAENRRARHDYQLLDRVEAGLVLTGTEVKSLRDGRATLAQSWADIRDGEAWLQGAEIATYDQGNRANHEPTRPRKLLLHRREIDRIYGQVREKGLTLVPTKLYFKDGRVKVELALARGKDVRDKRRDVADRDASVRSSALSRAARVERRGTARPRAAGARAGAARVGADGRDRRRPVAAPPRLPAPVLRAGDHVLRLDGHLRRDPLPGLPAQPFVAARRAARPRRARAAARDRAPRRGARRRLRPAPDGPARRARARGVRRDLARGRAPAAPSARRAGRI